MSVSPPFDSTITYYDAHADQYAAATCQLKMGGLYERFLALVPLAVASSTRGAGRGEMPWRSFSAAIR
jgi:hypothetical protein